MVETPSVISIQTGPTSPGDCELCTQPLSPRSAMVVVQLATGGLVQLVACDYCVRAIRRLAAASGGFSRFVVGEAPAREFTRPPLVPTPGPPGQASIPELICEYDTQLRSSSGVTYRVFAYGQPRVDSTWAGWLEFHPLRPGFPIRRTGQETSQPDRTALAYWANGLEPVYLEGAFSRAEPNRIAAA